MTAWTHLETAVELVKAGASDYVAKPWDDARLLTTVRNLLDLQAACAENRAIRRRRALARTGCFEAADGGTMFLDELGNLSPQRQAKLLRVPQTGEYERLGSNTTRRTRARSRATTGRATFASCATRSIVRASCPWTTW